MSLASCRSAASQSETTTPSQEASHYFQPIQWGPENEWILKMGGEQRTRGEYRDNFDLDRTIGDSDHLGFSRTRVNFDLSCTTLWRVFFEIWDVRELDERVHQRQEDHIDVHQLYLDLQDPADKLWRIRLGRQEMYYGERRLVDASRWTNLTRAFDGARFTWDDKQHIIDAFLVQQLYHDTIKDEEVISDRARRKDHEWFYGVYGTLHDYRPHLAELYFLGLTDLDDKRTFPNVVTSENGEYGTTDRFTVGGALRGPLWSDPDCGKLAYGTEAAWQFGHKAADEIRAYMIHGDVNYTWELPWKPRLSFEGNLASGDRDPDDGKSNTFNPLFGTSHGPYGIIDFLRLQNMRELALVGSVSPHEKLTLQLEYHRFWLDSTTDSWVNARGDSYGHDPLGRSGRELGDEVDVVATYKLNQWLTIEAGAAHFQPGEFADNVGRGDAANFVYLQTSLQF